MPLAGQLTDRLGARRVVPVGIAAAVLGTLAYTQVGAHTSYPYLAAALLVLGLGIGSTILPSMAAAFQTLSHQETPKATSALNVVQRIAGAIGTAVLAIVLQRSIGAGHGGIQGLAGLPPQQLTRAFGTGFWVALALIAAAIVPAMLLPRTLKQETAAVETSTEARAAA
jgi:MFS family permease